MPATEKLTNSPEQELKKATSSAKRKKPFIDADASENQIVHGWKKLKQAAETDLLVFKLSQEQTVKMEWASLSVAVQTAFEDVLQTVKHKGEVFDAETEGECFVFGFSDDCVQLSAICTVLNGKVAFFYKEESAAQE